jgi:hypothetical protein
MLWYAFGAALGMTILTIAAVWVGLRRLYNKVKVPLATPAGRAKANLTDPEWLREHVEYLSVQSHPRSYQQPETLEVVGGWIKKRFISAGAPRTYLQRFDAHGHTYYNVVGQFGPPPLHGQPLLVIGAHYDSCASTPGADDNASGVAGLIELIRLMAQYPAPPIAVEIVAYCLEEAPTFGTAQMGSAVHARSVRKRGCHLVAAIVLEMIGYFSDAPKSQKYPNPALAAIYPNTGNFIGVVGRWDQEELVRAVKAGMQSLEGVPVESIAAPRWLGSATLSDHSQYWLYDMPAVMITDTAFYRNFNYHQVSDSVDSLDYDRMAMVVDQVHSAVRSLALSAGAPLELKQLLAPTRKEKNRWSPTTSGWSPSRYSGC